MLDLAGLSLFPATPEQLLESRKRTHPQWSRGLSLEQYLKRDYVMDLEPHATDGKLITWYASYISLSERFYSLWFLQGARPAHGPHHSRLFLQLRNVRVLIPHTYQALT